MSQSLELRTIFADSTWATRNDDLSFSINLSEQMEVAPEHVMFLDNISIFRVINPNFSYLICEFHY